jgi:hypothetical protein
MNSILKNEPQSRGLIREYVGGTEVNGTGNSGRWVIDFGEMTELEARKHKALWAIVESHVRMTRTKAPEQVRLTPFWWFFNRRTEQYVRARMLSRVLARSAVSEYHAFRWFSPQVVFSHNVFVLIDSSSSTFAVLHSRIHEAWVDLTSSSLEDRQGYRPSDCLDTFPFPLKWRANNDVDGAGSACSDFRDALIRRTREGLTDTYNRFHDPHERDPDILRLRELHDAMDRAVLDAYGWTDIQPKCEFILDYEDEEDEAPGRATRRRKPWRYRWPDDARDEVLGRLLELNAQRAKEEALAGASASRRKRSSNPRGTKQPASPLLD